jgi:hypothetical protein
MRQVAHFQIDQQWNGFSRWVISRLTTLAWFLAKMPAISASVPGRL